MMSHKGKKYFNPPVILKFFMGSLLANRKNNMNSLFEKTATIITAKLKKLRSHVR